MDGRSSRPPFRGALFPALALLVLLRGTPVAADTFVLKSGGVIYGVEERRYVGANQKPWVAVKSGFGQIEVAGDEILRVLKSGASGGALYAAEILVIQLEGDVAKSSDGGKSWKGISFPPRVPTASSQVEGDPPILGANALVAPGDRIRTGKGGQIALDVGFGVLHVAPESEVEFRKAAGASMKIFSGEAGARLDSMPKGGGFQIETPQGVLAVKGTTLLVRVAQEARVAIGQGEGIFLGVSVLGGNAVESQAGGHRGPEPLTAAERESLGRVDSLPVLPRFARAVLPGGRFLMGSSDPGDASGRPLHPVNLSGFVISRFEATNQQYRAFAEWIRKTGDHGRCHPREPAGRNHTPEGWAAGGGTAADDQAVVGVDWFDAWAFCAWIGATLPSEAQWEYACRAGTTADRFYPGGSGADLEKYAWFKDNSSGAAQVVGRKLPNPWGLFDIYGNAMEWCADFVHPNYNGAPEDGRSWDRPSTESRILRGGGFDTPRGQGFAGNLKSAYRNGAIADSRRRDYGFRPTWAPGR